MDFEALLSEIKQQNFKAVYFLHGDEAYFIDTLAKHIENATLPEEQKAFNQTIFYGKDTDVQQVVDTARRLPMMAEHQLILLREAQEMRGLQELAGYVSKPVPSTILVISHKHKKLNGNSSLAKALKGNKEQAVLFEAKKLYDNKVPGWVSNYLKAQKLEISPDAAALVGEYLGSDLSKVANELDKLALNLKGQQKITAQEVEAHIGISKDYNVFELQKALGQRDIAKSSRIIQFFASNPKKNPLQAVVASLYNYFSKLLVLHDLKSLPDKDLASKLRVNPYFLREYRVAGKQFNRLQVEKALLLLAEYDLKSKGVGYDGSGKSGGELLKEMIWRILNG